MKFCGRVLHAHFMQRFHGLRNHAQRLARLGKFPARDGDHAVGLQVFEVFAKRLDRVEIVFAERECAGRRRRPGIHQRHLHHVVLVVAVAHKRAAIADMHVHLGNLVEVKRVVGEAIAHDVVGNDGIDFDAGDIRAAVGHGAQHVNATARPDDGEVAVRTQHVRHRRGRRHQVDAGSRRSNDRDRCSSEKCCASASITMALRRSLLVDLNPRERIPARIERRVALHALGIDDVDQAVVES